MKSRLTVFIEGLLYVVISAGAPWADFLNSDRVMTSRSIWAVAIGSVVAGAIALKAFLSMSMSNGEPEKPKEVIVANTPKQPVPTEEAPPANDPPVTTGG